MTLPERAANLFTGIDVESEVSILLRWCLLSVGLAIATPAIAAIPRSEAERAVADVCAALARDGGRLWGLSLAGPILFVDPATREVMATAADSAGVLRPEGTLFAGVLPGDINVANTALTWGGRLWSMVMWPLPSDTLRRRTLLLHELWHRVQGDLGLPSTGPANSHLDRPKGRLWLQLEWRALARALEGGGGERRAAIADALAFRAVRRRQFPGSAAEESALERHEGLAEYTGVRLASASAGVRSAYARAAIARSNALASFVRSFAYVSGPAYGLLLDDARPDWRRELGGGADLGELLRTALRLRMPDSIAAAAQGRAARYGLDSLQVVERGRERMRQERLTALRQRFVAGPTLRIPLRGPKLAFDPRSLQPLDTLGTVYGGLRITESWGVLDAPEGGLIAPDWSAVTIPAPTITTGDTLRGPGWTLWLSPPWELRPGARPGSSQLSAKP